MPASKRGLHIDDQARQLAIDITTLTGVLGCSARIAATRRNNTLLGN
jgi:hypothetical protein